MGIKIWCCRCRFVSVNAVRGIVAHLPHIYLPIAIPIPITMQTLDTHAFCTEIFFYLNADLVLSTSSNAMVTVDVQPRNKNVSANQIQSALLHFIRLDSQFLFYLILYNFGVYGERTNRIRLGEYKLRESRIPVSIRGPLSLCAHCAIGKQVAMFLWHAFWLLLNSQTNTHFYGKTIEIIFNSNDVRICPFFFYLTNAPNGHEDAAIFG